MRTKSNNTHISLAAIKHYLLYGTYPSGSTPSYKRSVRKRSEAFEVEDEELYYIVRPRRVEGEPPDPNPRGNRANWRRAVIMPKNQASIASQMHVSAGGIHMGTERTLNAISSKYYWVGMAASVRKVLKNCAVCLANRPAVSTIPCPQPVAIIPTSVAEIHVPSVNTESILLPPHKKEIPEELEPAQQEESPEDIQYIVTAELQEPEAVDSDLDFDPKCVVTDAVFDLRNNFDTARRFWQKVEIQVLGPLQYKKKRKSYVVVAIDSYSKWAEVQVLEKINEKYISQFIIKLIARFGVMEQVVIMDNEVTRELVVDSNGICQNLQLYNIDVSRESADVMDESWSRLIHNIKRFAELYVETWHMCLDLFLIPLRNSLTRVTDFTPSYLLMGREPSFPDSVLQGKDSEDVEITLSQDQIEKSIDSVMAHYMQCSVPDVKRVVVHPVDTELNSFDGTPLRKSGRKPKKYHRLAGFDSDGCELGSEDDATNPISGNKRKRSAGQIVAQKPEVDVKVTKVRKTETKEEDNVGEHEKQGMEKEDAELEVELDTYYAIIRLYKDTGSYPPHSSIMFRRAVRRVCESHVVDNGELMYKHGQKLKKVIVNMEDRLAVLGEAHVQLGEHMAKNKVIETLEAKNVQWKGMLSDVEAYVRACPDCKHGTMRKKRKMTARARRWLRGTEAEEDDSDYEANQAGDIGKVSFPELIEFIKKDIVPSGLSRSELLTFRKRAKNFKIEKGVLYFCLGNKSNSKQKKVLRTEEEKQTALREAVGEKPASRSCVLESLRKWCFWLDMADDVDQYLASHKQSVPKPELLDEDGSRRHVLIEERIKRFQDYFSGKFICPKKESLETLFKPKEKEKDTSELALKTPNKDLVAAAMESAMLPSCLGVAENSEEAPSGELPTHSAGEAGGIAESVTDASPLIGDSEHAQDYGREQVSRVMPDLKTEVVENKALANGSQSKIRQEEEEEEEEEEMERLSEDDQDEEWKPPHERSTDHHQQSAAQNPAKKSDERKRCEICSIVVKGENNYKEHLYRHTGIKPFICSMCPKKFTSVKGLRMHTRRHTGHRPFLCNICGRGFLRSASLRYHIKTHDKGGGVPVVCDICNRSFTTENRLSKHKRFKHPAQAPEFKCAQCLRTFTAKRSLKRHEEAHQGIKKYECQYCKRSFFRKEYLNYHLVSHVKEDSSLSNNKFRARQRRLQAAKKKKELLSVYCMDTAKPGTDLMQETVYQHIGEVNPTDWTTTRGRLGEERGMTLVFEPDTAPSEVGNSEPNQPGTTVVMFQEQPTPQGGMEVRQIIMPNDPLEAQKQQQQQQSQQSKQHTITIQCQGPPYQQQIEEPQQQQQHNGSDLPESIEVSMPGRTHTFTLPRSNQVAGGATQELVQYQVECLSGEALTEADFNAIRMLAQASLSGMNLVQQ